MDFEGKLTLSEMAAASAANGVYFNELEIPYKNSSNLPDKDVVTGGGAIASSPALYAYFLASESFKIPSEKMSVTIIGSIDGDTDKINSQVNLL
jgi:hypothetical protein